MEETIHYFRGLGVLMLGGILLAAGMWRFGIGVGSGNSAVLTSAVKTDKKIAALTFDVCWETESIEKILDILEEQDVKSTFFVTGKWVRACPEEARRILQEGHEIGNHSETHSDLKKKSYVSCLEEIRNTHNTVKTLTGYEMELFRAPYGSYDKHVLRAAKDSGYVSILWDVDSLDWKNYGADQVKKQVLENPDFGNGSIVVCRCGAEDTIEGLEALIEGFKEQGDHLVPVSQLLGNAKTLDFESEY